MFQGDIHHTGYSEAPGPRYGRSAWKLPVGLGWYARPVVEEGKVYVASPGMHTTSFCLDLATGQEIWKSTQEHALFGPYKYPAIASTPLVLNDRIVLREVNSHGGNEGQAKNLVYLDKATGQTLERKYAGHVDYRTQYAAVVTNGKYMVYPFAVHDIYGAPAICQNFNRLVCADLDNDAWRWDFNVGDIDALAEPVLTETVAIVGTMEGYLYALRLDWADLDDYGRVFASQQGDSHRMAIQGVGCGEYPSDAGEWASIFRLQWWLGLLSGRAGRRVTLAKTCRGRRTPCPQTFQHAARARRSRLCRCGQPLRLCAGCANRDCRLAGRGLRLGPGETRCLR